MESPAMLGEHPQGFPNHFLCGYFFQAAASFTPLAAIIATGAAVHVFFNNHVAIPPWTPVEFPGRAEERNDRGSHGSGNMHGGCIDADKKLGAPAQSGKLFERRLAGKRKGLRMAVLHNLFDFFQFLFLPSARKHDPHISLFLQAVDDPADAFIPSRCFGRGRQPRESCLA